MSKDKIEIGKLIGEDLSENLKAFTSGRDKVLACESVETNSRSLERVVTRHHNLTSKSLPGLLALIEIAKSNCKANKRANEIGFDYFESILEKESVIS